uniref:BILF1 n=1 Tax=Ateles paniscus lymphocryptovirus 1 TaxID=209266 RepID=A0A0A0RZC4_9GAMA|nr:BILF1 [Ateles paniscus lymphocryptovirus 1]
MENSTGPVIAPPTWAPNPKVSCNSTFHAGLSAFTLVSLGSESLFLLLLLLFLLIIRRFKDVMDLWLGAMAVDALLWILGKLLQEFSSTGLCVWTQHLMLIGLLASGLHHGGMMLFRAGMVSAKTLKPIKNTTVIWYLLFTFVAVIILALASMLSDGLDADLNRGPNLCREGASYHGHARRQAAKGFFFLLCCLLTTGATIYMLYRLGQTRLSARMRIMFNVAATGLLSALCWLLLAAPLVFRAEPGYLGYYCTSSIMPRYYPGFGALLTILLLLLYIWAHRKFVEDLRSSLDGTLQTIRLRSTTPSQ